MKSDHSVQPSSLSSLPPETVFVILSHLVAPKKLVPGRSYVDLIRTTLSNSYVRQVALAFHSLWTRIEITDSPVSFDLAKACLSRSGSQKLEVTIRITIRVGPKLPGVLALLKHVAARTRELRLQIGLSKVTQWEKMNDFLDALELLTVEYLALDLWDPWKQYLRRVLSHFRKALESFGPYPWLTSDRACRHLQLAKCSTCHYALQRLMNGPSSLCTAFSPKLNGWKLGAGRRS